MFLVLEHLIYEFDCILIITTNIKFLLFTFSLEYFLNHFFFAHHFLNVLPYLPYQNDSFILVLILLFNKFLESVSEVRILLNLSERDHVFILQILRTQLLQHVVALRLQSIGLSFLILFR